MQIETVQSKLGQASLAVQEVQALLAMQSPDLLVVAGSPAAHFSECATLLQRAFPDAAVIGCSSFGGILSEQGHCVSDSGDSLGVWALSDSAGSYGVGMQAYKQQEALANQEPIEQATRNALEDALLSANRPGEQPALIWLHSSPGQEECILRTLEQEVGGAVPVIGGAAAPNPGGNALAIHGAGRSSSAGLALAVLFPSGRVGYSFHSGCAMAKSLGVVTKAQGREIFELDGRPALQVYQHAIGQPVQEAIEQQRWTQLPVGRVIGEHHNMPVFSLVLPVAVKEQSIEFLAELAEGESIYLMHGTEQSLRGRSQRVLEGAKQMTPEGRLGSTPAGALVVYCACCKQVVSSDLDEVRQSMSAVLGETTPFITLFTYGEQGPLLESKNIHGNLMIAALVFFAEGA